MKVKIAALLGLLYILNFEVLAASKSKCLRKKNKICQDILKLNKNIDHKFAYKLSNQIHYTALKYKLDPKLLVAISFQESGFNPKAIRKVTGLVEKEDGSFEQVKVGSDFCLMQIHLINIKKKNLDVSKLLNDTNYCLETGAEILSEAREKFSKDDEFWWSYYNAKKKKKREIYASDVLRHLKKISPKYRKMASEI